MLRFGQVLNLPGEIQASPTKCSSQSVNKLTAEYFSQNFYRKKERVL